MKTAWRVLAALSLLFAASSAWLLFTSAAGTRMFAALQLFYAGVLASVACAVVSALLDDTRHRVISVALLAGYGLALLVFLGAMGSVR
ncbi:hypothetical protein ABB25_04790 [Stenotrophomonas koreensis]|jgi:hypothetical protein|uniref:Uncharacterized protein n=1 Tax=Stenotrophomonas koreensis TaxID=266128 RepID=A0A0R0BR89_9GAMM|nr:hypothetical protein [Stenotrophomonas koreensis]KRG59823.1 hypothetical protein ABB25_04790 [Stenotrophomonas koreensis]